MVRQYGNEFPERPLMATVSDLLGIPHFTTGRGSTVRKDFLVAVGHALGVRDPEGYDKEGLIREVWESATRSEMPADRLSAGGTVTNLVLQEISDGILRFGVPGRLESSPEPDPEPETGEEFDPSTMGDTRDRRLANVALREGRDSFRQAVLEAYGSKCSITRFDDPMTLQACHIAPYRGPEFNVVSNGLCLRADIHILFDRGAIAIHETNHDVLVKPNLVVGSYRDVLSGVKATLPRGSRDRPSVAALRAHRLWAGFEE